MSLATPRPSSPPSPLSARTRLHLRSEATCSIPPLMRAYATPQCHAPAFACNPHPPTCVLSIPHPSPLAHTRLPPSAFNPLDHLGPCIYLRLRPTSASTHLFQPLMHAQSLGPSSCRPSFTPPSSYLIAEASHSTPCTLDLSFVNHPALDQV
ncbi:hypothetical protein HETIRDRAFT_108706 [Heterobasidion irregulare TC 32-1]|uniref:Uncharacterized protein n=1 Tax=Heterobasidion irregulare (strain TC 32-1) TaxID=747525 RepID=W4K9I8_HETIT|nr:uncharacterized protein HETIRDRAFT_108706 [Heterobasidion irregulare TC 32-1]ETW82404.1 hypothetical protein HETIRDRAFT_108706 [Heterobasidion irregulare TC 32-1]